MRTYRAWRCLKYATQRFCHAGKQFGWKTNCALDIRHNTNIFTTQTVWIRYSLWCSTQKSCVFIYSTELRILRRAWYTKHSQNILRSTQNATVNEKHVFYQDTTPTEILKCQTIQVLPDWYESTGRVLRLKMYEDYIVLIDNIENSRTSSRSAMKITLYWIHFNTLLSLHISKSKDSCFMNRSDLKLAILVN